MSEHFPFDGGTVFLSNIVPLPGPWTTMNEVYDANRNLGHHWFSQGAMEFFGTKVKGWNRDNDYILYLGRFFLTVDTEPSGDQTWSIRAVTNYGRIRTVGRFQHYASRQEAHEAMDRLLEHLEELGAL